MTIPQKQKPRYNPVAKFARKFNKSGEHKDKTKYSRKNICKWDLEEEA
jgi:hypothetical protein